MKEFITTILDDGLDRLLSNELKLEVVQDDDTYSPRDNSNAGILCVASNHITNETHDFDIHKHKNWGQVEKWLRAKKGAIAVIPVYLYNHSGIFINTTGFDCKWDSGQAGLYYTTKLQYMECVDNYLETSKIKQVLEQEIEALNKYFTGDIYAYKITNKLGNVIEFAGNYYDYKEAEAEGNIELKSLQKEYNNEILHLKSNMARIQELPFITL